MSDRPNALRLHFRKLANGSVVLDNASESLLPTGQPVIEGPRYPQAQNIRLNRGLAKVRSGYIQFADIPDTNAVIGLHHALYDDDTEELIRGTKNSLHRYNAGATGGPSWEDINAGATGPETINATDNDTWVFAEVDRTGAPTPGNETFMCNGVDAIFQYRPGMAAILPVGASVLTAARVLVHDRGRAVAMNVKDSGGVRRTQRFQWPIQGDPTTWSGPGSGFTDLDNDAYPIAAAVENGGRISIYKGNNEGGSIAIATRTGALNTPYRFDHIDTQSGVGILAPRTLVPIVPDVNFFLSHIGFVVHDGARTITPVAPGISESILERINSNALRAAVAWLRPKTGEVVVGIPTGAATTPSEYWVIKFPERTVTGPWAYTHAVTSVATYGSTGALTIDTLPGPSIDSLPYPSIDTMGGAATAATTIFGTAQGLTVEDRDTDSADLGAPVSGTLTLPPVTPALFSTQQRRFTDDDELTLHDIVIGYKDSTVWTPQVEVSTDGGSTWTTVSDGSSVGSGATNRVRFAQYTTTTTSNWIQVRISGQYGMELHSVTLEFTHGGSTRAN